jgi:Na+-transporting methylmalonyl-CoA/oxaloacetate decarboxylase gamma subunit
MAAFARHALIWSGAGLASIMTGIAICLVHSLTGLGVVLIIAPFLAGIIWVIAAVARDAAEQHHGWISQHTPAQQAPIRQAENAAAWAATAAAAVALHESSKRNRARLGASVTGTGPPPGKAGAAMWAARQRDQAARERQELPGAIRQSGQDQDSQGLQPKRWVPPGTQQ